MTIKFEVFEKLIQVFPAITLYSKEEKDVIAITWLSFGLIINIFKGTE
jgi:hypothetical protein